MLPCPPPHPSPSRPRMYVPPNACDCHFHVFGPAARYPYAEPRDYTPPDAPLDRYRGLLATLGIDRGVLVLPSVYGTDNTSLLDALAAEPERLRGVAVVPPEVPDRELQQMHAAGVRGVRFNLGNTTVLHPDALEPMAERLAPLGWHIQVHAPPERFAQVVERLAALPVPVVIDHFGRFRPEDGLGHPGFRALLHLVAEGNGWVKLSAPYRNTTEGPPYEGMRPLAEALLEAAPERCVWGTDWPHPHVDDQPMPDDGDLVDALSTWCLDDALRRRVLVDNPARLYDFG